MARSQMLRHLGWLSTVALILGSGALVQAQQESAETVPSATAEKPGDDSSAAGRGYWLGLGCVPVDAEYREAHKLSAEQAGVVVEDVVPTGPADRGGIRSNDVLMKAGDQVLSSIEDLAQAVQSSEGKPLKIELLRDGKTVSVEVTPEQRPRRMRSWRERGEAAAGDWTDRLREAFEAFTEGEGPGMSFWRIGPGVVVLPPLPDDVTIQLRKQGQQPAQITVERGDKKWEVNEEQLGQLPDDVRPHVERMLGRGPMRPPVGFSLPGFAGGPHPGPGGPHGGPGGPHASGPAPPGLEPVMDAVGRLRHEMERLDQQMHRLRTEQAPELERRLQHELAQVREALAQQIGQRMAEFERLTGERMRQLDELLNQQRAVIEQLLERLRQADKETKSL